MMTQPHVAALVTFGHMCHVMTLHNVSHCVTPGHMCMLRPCSTANAGGYAFPSIWVIFIVGMKAARVLVRCGTSCVCMWREGQCVQGNAALIAIWLATLCRGGVPGSKASPEGRGNMAARVRPLVTVRPALAVDMRMAW